MDCVQRPLDDANLTAAQIDQVVLVGGSTRTPLIGQLLEDRLGQPAHREVNPDLCVAMGAAVQAAIIAGQNVGAVLVDITPHTLGIKCLEYAGRLRPFRERSSSPRSSTATRPCRRRRSEVFRTVKDSQATVEIDVYQGENEDVRRNHRVGRFLSRGWPRCRPGTRSSCSST